MLWQAAIGGELLASWWWWAHDRFMSLLSIFEGLSAGLRVQDSPLYRYPYRNALEAFRGDAKRIGRDIEASLEQYSDE